MSVMVTFKDPRKALKSTEGKLYTSAMYYDSSVLHEIQAEVSSRVPLLLSL
jgi:hypothetical protein